LVATLQSGLDWIWGWDSHPLQDYFHLWIAGCLQWVSEDPFWPNDSGGG
jgi:hypothetical protein